MNRFAHWLDKTSLCHALRHQEAWLTPGTQSIHIIGIAIIMGSVLMMMLRILGVAGTDQTMRQTTARYGPWFIGALCLQLVTGVEMILTEPIRELINFSFWAKMIFIAIATVICGAFLVSVSHNEEKWESLVNRKAIKSLAVVTFVLFICIIFLGRLIAYDHIWGSWSPATSEF